MTKIRKNIALVIVFLLFTFILPITVNNKQVKGANLNYSSVTMMQGATFKLKIQGMSKKVKWSSSNKKIATVKKGKVTAFKVGKCTITAKVKGKTYKCKITVKKNSNYIPKKKKFKDVTLNMAALKLDVSKTVYTKEGKAEISGEKGTYTLKLLNTKKTPKWKTNNTKIATVDAGIITAVGKGNCVVRAVIGKKSYKCKVTITDLKDAEKISHQENVYQMLGLINIDRVKAKSAPLKIKEELNKVADIRANESKKSFSHTRPNGTLYKTAYADVGFKVGRALGENLAYTRDKVEYMGNFINVAYKSLYKSKSHRENMLNRKFEYIGIGYTDVETYFDDYGALCAETYWAQEFYTK